MGRWGNAGGLQHPLHGVGRNLGSQCKYDCCPKILSTMKRVYAWTVVVFTGRSQMRMDLMSLQSELANLRDVLGPSGSQSHPPLDAEHPPAMPPPKRCAPCVRDVLPWLSPYTVVLAFMFLAAFATCSCARGWNGTTADRVTEKEEGRDVPGEGFVGGCVGD